MTAWGTVDAGGSGEERVEDMRIGSMDEMTANVLTQERLDAARAHGHASRLAGTARNRGRRARLLARLRGEQR